jgi:hypothetical protein
MEPLKSPSDLEKLRKSILTKKDPKKPAIAVCVSTGCEALGVKGVLAAFKEEFLTKKTRMLPPSPYVSAPVARL